MAERRKLRFESLDDAVRDAEHLLAAGYEKTGQWDLAQVCNHLSAWFRYQMEGFPRLPLLLRPVFWTIRHTIGGRIARKAFASGEMKPGLPTAPQSVLPPGGDDAKAVADLRSTIAQWEAFNGPLHASPIFGRMTKEQYRVGHLIHAAHHLGFLVPKS